MIPYTLHLRNAGKCPSGWNAYRGLGDEKGFYYIIQPNELNEMVLYRCSKDWEPSYEVKNKFVVEK